MEKQLTDIQWQELTHQLGKRFAERAAGHDREGTFVEENYADLKTHGYFSAMIPQELGGGGISHGEMCGILRIIGQYCGSTALCLSMHQHLLAANIWKYKQGKGGDAILRKVAEQQLILVSTGARDWLESNGEMQKVEGGYRVSALKHFASQSAIGDVLVTSAPYQDPENGWQVLHFAVPFSAEGLSVMSNWDTLGMRGTGSNTVKLENVFVPDEAIVLQRPRGEFHPVWVVVLTVAMPLIMSAYVGVAEHSANIAINHARNSKFRKPHLPYVLGEMNNQLTAAQVQLRDMIRICNNFDFQAVTPNAHEILTRKTNVTNAAIETVRKAMETVGGHSYFKKSGLEQLFRDIQAAHYHPLPEKEQQLFCGEFILNGN